MDSQELLGEPARRVPRAPRVLKVFQETDFHDVALASPDQRALKDQEDSWVPLELTARKVARGRLARTVQAVNQAIRVTQANLDHALPPIVSNPLLRRAFGDRTSADQLALVAIRAFRALPALPVSKELEEILGGLTWTDHPGDKGLRAREAGQVAVEFERRRRERKKERKKE
jgi:hypothetical protein